MITYSSSSTLFTKHAGFSDAEMSLCFNDARDDPDIGVVILTGTFST